MVIALNTILHGVTVSELLFSGGFGRCFWGSANQFSANRAPSTHHAPLNPGTAHPLAAYATVTLRHFVPSSRPRTPSFLRVTKKLEEAPSGPTRSWRCIYKVPSSSAHSIPTPLHPPLLSTLNLLLQQSSRGNGRPFFSIAIILPPSLTRLAAVSTSRSTIS
jgi:hypothetical protein